MLPHYNSFHQNAGQAHPPGANGGSSAPSPLQQQGIMPFNPSLANSCNMFPPSMGPQPGFMNLPNNLLPMQNNHMRMPMTQFGSLGPSVGFCPPQNMNLATSYPFNGQFCNMGQNVNQVNQNMGFAPAQLFGHNLMGLQQMNQNMGPYGQFCLPNMLNMNQVVPLHMQMQMLNPCQAGPNYAFGGSNQAPQAAVQQNPAFSAAPNFGSVHSPNKAGQQINQNQQTNVYQGTQGNHVKPGGAYNSNSNRKNSPSKSFPKHPNRGSQPQGGFQNSQFHHMKNGKGKFASSRHNRKGFSSEQEGKYALTDSMNQGRETKRSLSLSYTEQEVQLWREERKKNFPSNTNIEKKLSQQMMDSEAIEREAKARREQLKEILTKQAEMGVEVAEIPSHYLSDSEKQGNGKEENRSRTNNRRSQNKFGKRDRYDKKDRFAKRQRPNQKDSSNEPSFSKREPTLLQKLLSSDIKRDKSRLCQVFRFMVTNSFFKDFPDKPLKFPTVEVKESVGEDCLVEELSSVAGKGAYAARDKSMIETYNDDHEDDEDEEGMERTEEEEGEIIN